VRLVPVDMHSIRYMHTTTFPVSKLDTSGSWSTSSSGVCKNVMSLCSVLPRYHVASMHAMSGHVSTEADHSGNGMEDAEDFL
jgi:hypothetical protein